MPRITEFDWVGGMRILCPDMTSNHIISPAFRWKAPEAKSIEFFVARHEHDIPATSGFSRAASGVGEAGVVNIPLDCGNGGPNNMYTLKIVAKNASGSVTAYLTGGIALG